MKTMLGEAQITEERMLRIELPCDLPPEPVEVVVVVGPRLDFGRAAKRRWDELYGLGREVWQGIDTQQYVADLRQDREQPNGVGSRFRKTSQPHGKVVTRKRLPTPFPSSWGQAYRIQFCRLEDSANGWRQPRQN